MDFRKWSHPVCVAPRCMTLSSLCKPQCLRMCVFGTVVAYSCLMDFVVPVCV